ncbi:MAG: hypothetical protein JXR94_11395 [Candidatus Hydrogenedentes bacterium]|nr:hypothetical protein [Candidatus Hydrogenedentota bacterium]
MRNLLALLLVAFGSAAMAADLSWDAPNLVQNPGFETPSEGHLPDKWSGDAKIYGRDTGTAHTGTGSLRFVNPDPNTYRLCSQRVPLERGCRYEFSAWVKTEGIEGRGSGAGICVEYYGPDKKYLSGVYPPGVVGTSDWTQIRAVTRRVPEEAESASVTCYVRKEMAGTAWWDDVVVRRHRANPLTAMVLSPNYRNEIADAGPRRARIRADIDLEDYPHALGDVCLTWQVVNREDGRRVASGRKRRLAQSPVDVVVPGTRLEPGRYDVELALVDKGSGRELGTRQCELTRIAGTPERTAYIDEYNRLILDGEPFFPLGMYWSVIREEQLDVFADSPFNCLMPYHMPSQEQMDWAHERGLKVIYSVKDCYTFLGGLGGSIKTEADERVFIRDKVEAFRAHPALLAWYLNDEAPISKLDRLVAHREWVEELDPNHPTWTVLYQVDEVAQYVPSFHAIGTDPYPIPKRPASSAGEWARKTVAAVHDSRPVWMVPQVFNWACYRKSEEERKACRLPTPEEVRSMTWQCLAEGARGLVYYSWFNIHDPSRNAGTDFDTYWPQIKAIAQEVSDLAPVLLSVEKPPKFTVPEEPWLNWTARRIGKTSYLIVVNNDVEAHSAAFGLPRRPGGVTDFSTGAALPVSGRRTLRLEFPRLGVYICEITGLR